MECIDHVNALQMEEIYKIYKHNPPHWFRPNAKYMVTGSIYNKVSILKTDLTKEKLLMSIIKGCEKYNWGLEDWVILGNHYHLMMNAPENVVTLSKLINEVHKFVALWIKKNISTAKIFDKIFSNYWDTCITYERSYFARLNYIYFNCVKHGYTDNPEEYPWGSYYYRYKTEKEKLTKLEKKYPWDRVNIIDNF